MTVLFNRLWEMVLPYRVRLVLGVVSGIISGLIEPLSLFTLIFVFGAVFPSAHQGELEKHMAHAPQFVQDWLHNVQVALAGQVQAHRTAVIVLVALIPVVVFLRGVFAYLNVYFLQWTAVRAVTDLRVRLFSHLLNLSSAFFNTSRSGELISRILGDTQALQQILSNATSTIVKDPVTIIGLMAGLLWLHPKITLIAMVVMPLSIVPIAIYSRKARRSAKAMQSHTAGLADVMSEAFTGNRVVRAYNLENTVIDAFYQTARKFIGHYMRVVRSAETPGPLLEFFGAIGLALVILSGVKDQHAAADFLTVILAIFMMYKPMKSLTKLHNQIVQARAATDRIYELLAMRNPVVEPQQPRLLKSSGADIHFDKVEFAYGDKPVLRGIDLHIKSGQLVALVGSSGSGKTTLANLLLRFDDPQRGSVRIGDADIREFATRDLRSQIAVVTQETILFNETIRRNIELGRPGASEADIIAAAKHAHAHEFILEKPQGYDTLVGEKGVMLSGGQRQRLAIARAVLRDAPILILDEATSALDTESERAVQEALDELMKGRTTICIAHRLSTVMHADVIVVLDHGQIVETGKHAELLRSGGIYQKLYEMQFRA